MKQISKTQTKTLKSNNLINQSQNVVVDPYKIFVTQFFFLESSASYNSREGFNIFSTPRQPQREGRWMYLLCLETINVRS